MLLQNYFKACAHFSYSPVTCHVVKGDKILLSLGREIIGVDCVFRELGVSQLDIDANIYQHRAMVDAEGADSRRCDGGDAVQGADAAAGGEGGGGGSSRGRSVDSGFLIGFSGCF